MAVKRSFKEVQSGDLYPFWKPEEEGQSIEGNVGKVRQVSGDFGLQDVVDIVGEEGFTVNVSAGVQILHDLEGKYIRLTWLGKRENPNTGREFHAYKVEVAD